MLAGGSWRARRDPTQAQGEHAGSTLKDFSQSTFFKSVYRQNLPVSSLYVLWMKTRDKALTHQQVAAKPTP